MQLAVTVKAAEYLKELPALDHQAGHRRLGVLVGTVEESCPRGAAAGRREGVGERGRPEGSWGHWAV